MNGLRSAFDVGMNRGSRRLPSPMIAVIFLLVIASLHWAQAVLIPVALAILLTFLLGPAISALQKTGLGRVPSVALVIVLTFSLPVMETKISYYQRLLAMDQDEAVDLVEDYLKRRPREQVYDEVLLSALSYAKRRSPPRQSD